MDKSRERLLLEAAVREKGAGALKLQAAAMCDAYRLAGYHCSESVIRACDAALGLGLSPQALRCACGFRGGGGGFGGRCGVIEAGIMLISACYGRDGPTASIAPYSSRIVGLQQSFLETFGSMDCREINPAEIRRIGNCGRVFREGAPLIIESLCGTNKFET